jgi:hypothetical protein
MSKEQSNDMLYGFLKWSKFFHHQDFPNILYYVFVSWVMSKRDEGDLMQFPNRYVGYVSVLNEKIQSDN